MANKGSESLSDKIIALGGIVLLLTLLGGAFGYYTQTGMMGAGSKNSAIRRKATEAITREEYKRRTRIGWWVGCGAGCVLGIISAFKTSKRK